MDFPGLRRYVQVLEKWLDFISGRQEELRTGMKMRADIK
jgi:hypothetical protein